MLSLYLMVLWVMCLMWMILNMLLWIMCVHLLVIMNDLLILQAYIICPLTNIIFQIILLSKTVSFLWLIMWNVQKCAVSRIGNARLKISRFELVSKNVRHVCDLNHNLISCAVLEDEDFRVNAKTAWWRLWMIYIVLLFWKQLE